MLPDKKISQTLLEFAAPLLDELDDDISKDQVDAALRIAIGIWNAHTLDRRDGTTTFVDEIRKLMRNDLPPEALPFIELLIERKRTLYKDDPRGIGNHSVFFKDGELTVRADGHLMRRVSGAS